MEYVKSSCEEGDILVIAYNDATPDNIWRLTNEILAYPEGFYVSEGNPETIVDGKFISAETFTAYVADNENKEEVIKNLLYSNLNVTEYEEIYQRDMWTLYRFY